MTTERRTMTFLFASKGEGMTNDEIPMGNDG